MSLSKRKAALNPVNPDDRGDDLESDDEEDEDFSVEISEKPTKKRKLNEDPAQTSIVESDSDSEVEAEERRLIGDAGGKSSSSRKCSSRTIDDDEVDSMWAALKAANNPVSSTSSSSSSSSLSSSSSSATSGVSKPLKAKKLNWWETSKPQTKAEDLKITRKKEVVVKQTRKFGSSTVEVELEANSEEAKQYMERRSGMDNIDRVIEDVLNTKKVTVYDKSRADWETDKRVAGDKDDLERHARGKDSLVSKEFFKTRVAARIDEQRRQMTGRTLEPK